MRRFGRGKQFVGVRLDLSKRMAGDPPDIFLTPRLAHVGLLEFYKAEEVINEGKACVSRALPALETLLHRDFGHAHQGD